VFCIDYHNPVVLIKSAMTIDLLSGGRLEFGLGAGWLEEEYAAVGLRFDPPRHAHRPARRRHRGRQGLSADRAWPTCTTARCSGGTSKVAEAGVEAADHDRRRQPAGAAAGGPRGRHRQPQFQQPRRRHRAGWRATSSEGGDPAQARLGREGAGDRFDDLEIEIGAYFTFVMDDPTPVLENFATMFGFTPDEMRRHPHALFGSVDTICEELRAPPRAARHLLHHRR
jgi:alkanesulfonate monooxygenase SsuD/methylene tetrahydromethanopterin reductase-like flavin-dependent oxidoreductase (luciferase family)